jgi:hypothetical protein
MPKYRVYGKVVGTKYLGTFEVSTHEVAINRGLTSQRAVIRLCHHCAHQVDDLEVEDAFAEPVENE